MDIHNIPFISVLFSLDNVVSVTVNIVPRCFTETLRRSFWEKVAGEKP